MTSRARVVAGFLAGFLLAVVFSEPLATAKRSALEWLSTSASPKGVAPDGLTMAVARELRDEALAQLDGEGPVRTATIEAMDRVVALFESQDEDERTAVRDALDLAYAIQNDPTLTSLDQLPALPDGWDPRAIESEPFGREDRCRLLEAVASRNRTTAMFLKFRTKEHREMTEGFVFESSEARRTALPDETAPEAIASVDFAPYRTRLACPPAPPRPSAPEKGEQANREWADALIRFYRNAFVEASDLELWGRFYVEQATRDASTTRGDELLLAFFHRLRGLEDYLEPGATPPMRAEVRTELANKGITELPLSPEARCELVSLLRFYFDQEARLALQGLERLGQRIRDTEYQMESLRASALEVIRDRIPTSIYLEWRALRIAHDCPPPD